MKLRVLSALLLSLLCLRPAGFASEPVRPVAKLVPNPRVESNPPGGPNGLPGVTCGGFTWFTEVPSSPTDPGAPIVLNLALVPFRSSETVLYLGDGTNDDSIARIRFADGLVNGLRYRRFAWNDVVVTLRPLEQEYILRINGAEAGPFLYPDECQTADDCLGLGSIVLTGGFNDPGVAWLDTISVVRQGAGGDELVWEVGFDICFPYSNVMGGLLVTDPPAWLDPAR